MATTHIPVISADGHTVEPPDMWQRFLPSEFQDRAPRVVKDPKGGDAWEYVPGAPPVPLGLVTNRGLYGKRYEDLEWYGETFESIRAGVFDAKARIEEQDIDGVAGEVLYPSQRMMATFMAQEDDAYHLAGVDAYNAWIRADFMEVAPERLIPMAQMPGVDTPAAVRALHDAKQAGFRGVVISAWPSGGARLSPDDDPFWAAAEEASMPIHIHDNVSQAGKRTAAGKQATARHAARQVGLADMGGPVGEASLVMSELIYDGVFDRFPALTMVAVETGAGWVPHWLEHMDDHYWRNRVWTESSLEMLPSEYFRRNWKITFIREPFTMRVRHWIGVPNLMWSSDYPHHRHDWPYSRRVIEETMAGVPDEERRLMLHDNAALLYNLP